MKKIALVGLAFLGLSGATPPQSQPAVAASFRLTLVPTPTCWSAHCDSGCAWIDATIGCARACNVVVDAYGLGAQTPAIVTTRDSSDFLFVAERAGDEVRAVARHGTAWTTLSWSCRGRACPGVIDGFGVSGQRATR